jgi:hypothetical protein
MQFHLRVNLLHVVMFFRLKIYIEKWWLKLLENIFHWSVKSWFLCEFVSRTLRNGHFYTKRQFYLLVFSVPTVQRTFKIQFLFLSKFQILAQLNFTKSSPKKSSEHKLRIFSLAITLTSLTNHLALTLTGALYAPSPIRGSYPRS